MKNQTYICVTGLVLASLSFAMPAQASEFEVRYTKSELATQAGAENVFHRIHKAAEAHCSYQFTLIYASKSRARYDRCMRRTIKGLVAQVNHPHMDQAHASFINPQKKQLFATKAKRIETPYNATQ